LSIDGAESLLDGWVVERAATAKASVAGAAQLLQQFGATVNCVRAGARDDTSLRVVADRGRGVEVSLSGCGAGRRGLPCAPPNGSLTSAYGALRLAGVAALAGRRGIDARLLATTLVGELVAPLQLSGGTSPELIRCRDGWVVVRWREESERELLRTLTGPEHERDRAEVVAAARLARLLVGSVEPPPARAVPFALGDGVTSGQPGPRRRRPRVVDWSVLWAGPWAAHQLACSGAMVQRVEHPRRRDGLLDWQEGRRWWRRLNVQKRLSLLDARERHDRQRLEHAIGDADILVTSMTPRALRSLGFDDDWRSQHAPGLLHIELVAFDAPWDDAPGLGEHAAAEAGLLWRHGKRPAPPHPWADPLLGAGALALVRVWLASANRPGGRVRLTLRQAASLAFASAQSGIE
jgi:CoA-transferase family III